MKKAIARFFLFLLTVSILLTLCSGCASRRITDSPDVQSELQMMVKHKYADFALAYNLPPHLGMFLYIETEQDSYSAKAGFSDKPYTENTHYRIASVSKTFTAASIMLLDQMGKLRIEDSVVDAIPGRSISYLPDTWEFAIPYKEEITIKDLLSHRAGVFDVFNEIIPETSSQPYAGQNYIGYIQDTEGDVMHPYTLAELSGVIAIDQLTYGKPGTLYHYSDSGYMLLPVIIERVAQMPFEEFLLQNFFLPMNLTGTYAVHEPDDTTLTQPFFEGYTRWDAEFFITTEDNMTSNIGAGHIISTPKDMARWIRPLLLAQGPLSELTIETMKTVVEGNSNYSLGLSHSALGVGHSGAHPGYMNIVVYNEEHDAAIVMVAPFIDYNEGNMEHIIAALTVMQEIMSEALTIMEKM